MVPNALFRPIPINKGNTNTVHNNLVAPTSSTSEPAQNSTFASTSTPATTNVSNNTNIAPAAIPSLNSQTSFSSTIAPGANNESKSLFPTTITTATSPEDLRKIAPIFFTGLVDSEQSNIIFDSQSKGSDPVSIGYGQRRLSGVFSKVVENATERNKTEQQQSEVSKKRVILNTSDANRGLFGDGKVIKKQALDSSVNVTTSSIPTATPISRSVCVFGFPSAIAHTVISYFDQYGKIEKYKQAAGNWIIITFETSSSATAALKSNGAVFLGKYLIGVKLEIESPVNAACKVLVPTTEITGLYKSDTTGLGSGKAGVSANDRKNSNVEGNNASNGFLTRIQDAFFAW